MINWDPIAPGEVLLSSINWNPRLGLDTIVSSIWSPSVPPGLTLTSNIPAFGAGYTYIWISGAVLDTVYMLKNTIGTAAGDTEIETVVFICANK